MLSFLLFLSLLFHLVTFTIIRFLYAKVKKANPSVKQLKQTVTEMEELLNLHLQEMKEENNYLLGRLKQEQKDSASGTVIHQPSSSAKSASSSVLHSDLDNNSSFEREVLPKDEYMPPMPTEQQDTWEQSMAGKVLALHEQGETIEEIARKLDSGKTEIQLLLKFHQKNN